MIKSWVSFLLPDDEYKRQRILHFFAEGSILLLMYIGMFFIIEKLTNWDLNLEVILGLSIVVFVSYVFARYILSGIEYTDIATDKQYKKEISTFIKESITFFIIFFTLSSMFIGTPGIKHNWFETLAVSIIAAILLFLINYISLKRSYKKNKELINE